MKYNCLSNSYGFQYTPSFPLQRTYLAEQSRHDSDANGRVQNVRGSALSSIDTFCKDLFLPLASHQHTKVSEITVYRMASFDIPKQRQAAVRQGSGDSTTATIQKVGRIISRSGPNPCQDQLERPMCQWQSLIHDE